MSSNKRARNDRGNPRAAKRHRKNSSKRGHSKNEQLQLQMLADGSPNDNCFGNSWFELGVCIATSSNADDIYSNFDESVSISPKLVFENGDTGTDIELITDPKELEIESDGTLRFNVKINTLSMYHDNRQFKIVFSVKDAPKHINSVTTKPFRLVYVFVFYLLFFVCLFFVLDRFEISIDIDCFDCYTF